MNKNDAIELYNIFDEMIFKMERFNRLMERKILFDIMPPWVVEMTWELSEEIYLDSYTEKGKDTQGAEYEAWLATVDELDKRRLEELHGDWRRFIFDIWYFRYSHMAPTPEEYNNEYDSEAGGLLWVRDDPRVEEEISELAVAIFGFNRQLAYYDTNRGPLE